MELQLGNDIIKIIFQQKKITRTYIKITNRKEVLITSPNKLSQAEINKLIQENQNWIVNRLSKLNIINIDEDEFLLFGMIYKVSISDSKNILINNNTILINNASKIEEYALNEIHKRFNAIIKQLNLSFLPELKFRRMRSRWGVCHFKVRKVVLNKVLIHLPWQLIDYIIYHELTHFKVPNHSKTFYQELVKICPKHKSLKTHLIEYSSLL